MDTQIDNANRSPEVSEFRVACGFLIAPGLPALAIRAYNGGSDGGLGDAFTQIVLAFSYLSAFILGIPAYLLARKLNLRLPGYVVLACVIGIICNFLFHAYLVFGNTTMSAETVIRFLGGAKETSVLALGCSASAGALLWMIAFLGAGTRRHGPSS